MKTYKAIVTDKETRERKIIERAKDNQIRGFTRRDEEQASR